MHKIPTLFVRNPDDRRFVTSEITPGCEWVFDDPAAVATRKYDGTCTMLDDSGKWWARREVRAGRPAPASFVEVDHDAVTGHTVGWEPIEQSGFVKFHAEALQPDNWLYANGHLPGTYELVGPKINGNPEKLATHRLVSHARALVIDGLASDFETIAAWLREVCPFEGVVWHHPDGRMAKLKRRDVYSLRLVDSPSMGT